MHRQKQELWPSAAFGSCRWHSSFCFLPQLSPLGFRNVQFGSEYKTINPVNLSVMYHRQNSPDSGKFSSLSILFLRHEANSEDSRKEFPALLYLLFFPRKFLEQNRCLGRSSKILWLDVLYCTAIRTIDYSNVSTLTLQIQVLFLLRARLGHTAK